MRRAAATGLIVAGIVLAAGSCSRGGEKADKAPPAVAPVAQPAQPTPRDEGPSPFESRSWLEGPGLSPETKGLGIAMAGRVLAGPTRIDASAPSARSLAVAALEEPAGSVLVVVGPRGEGRASLTLSSPPLSLAAARGTVVAACEDGSIQCFAVGGGEGEPSIEKRWIEADRAAGPLIVMADGGEAGGGAKATGKVFAALRDGSVECLSLAEGRRSWAADAGGAIADIAYAKGIVVACAGDRVAAYAEADGGPAWKAEIGEGRPLAVAAGQGLVAVVGAGGGLSILGAGEGKPLSTAEGSYDPAIRPAIEGGIVYVALPGGGAAAIEAKGGKLVRTWAWAAPTSFLLVDDSFLYASSGRRLVVRSRFEEGGGKDIELPSAPTSGAGELVAFEGGVLAACRGGLAASARVESRLDAIMAPPAESASAIEGALASLGGEWLSGKKPTYGEFISGTPIYPPEGFTVLRYEAREGSRRSFSASPDPGDALIAIFDERGVKVASNADELGSPGRLTAWLEGGRTYWIAAAGRGARLEGGFLLVAK